MFINQLNIILSTPTLIFEISPQLLLLFKHTLDQVLLVSIPQTGLMTALSQPKYSMLLVPSGCAHPTPLSQGNELHIHLM